MRTFVIGDIHGRRTQLEQLLAMLPRDPARDTLVMLGDLIDRGDDAPGVVETALRLQRESPERVRVLRGNHEQMLLDLVDDGAPLWFHPTTGGDRTYEQYTGEFLPEMAEWEPEEARQKFAAAVPAEHLEFFRQMPFFYEDEWAIYVHAGLSHGRHPRETEPHYLLWTRNNDFFRHYYGKPCVFGHTPTAFLPLFGRLGRHGIYIAHSAIGLDTGYNQVSPLSCLSFPDFMLYQTFADGHADTHRITAFIPEPLREMQKRAGSSH